MNFAKKIYFNIIGQLGNLYQISGNYGKAREMCEISAKNGGNCAAALNLYGVVLLEEGDVDNALKYLMQAKDVNKNKVAKKHITMSIASCYWLKGEIEKAILTIEGLLEQYDYINPDVYTTLGYMHMLNNDNENAFKYTQKALYDNERHAPAYDNLGQIYMRMGETEKASENFKKALEINENMTDSKYYLGELQEMAGNIEEAKKLFLSAKGDRINALNTVSKAQINEKCKKYYNDMGEIVN